MSILSRARPRRRYAVLLVTSLSACLTSPTPARYEPARAPGGVASEILLTNGATRTGELLAIDDSAYVVLSKGRVGMARFSDVARVNLQPYLSLQANRPSAEMLEQARLFARFPFGIPGPAMIALLSSASQTAPDDLARPVP